MSHSKHFRDYASFDEIIYEDIHEIHGDIEDDGDDGIVDDGDSNSDW